MKNIIRSFLISGILSIWVLFLLFIFSRFDFVEKVGNTINDTFTYRLQYGQNMHSGDVVIIAIDDRTLDSLWKSDLWMIAFDKWVYADMIEKAFSYYGAAVIGLDIVFANPSVLGEEDEKKLQTTLEKYHKNLVIATRSDYTPRPLCLYSDVQHGAIDTIEQERLRVFQLQPYSYDLQAYCGQYDIYPWNDQEISILSRETLEKYLDWGNPFFKQEVMQKLEALDDSGEKLQYINYYSDGKKHAGTFGYESYSFIDIYDGKQQTPEWEVINLKDKIVLVGEVGTLVHDAHFTPVHYSMKMPWVEVNANIITTLLRGETLQKASWPLTYILIFFLQSFLIFCVMHVRLRWTIIITILSLFLWIIFGAWMFVLGDIYNIFLWIIWAVGSVFIAYIYRFQVTDKSKRILKKQFSSYVSSDVVEEISQNPNSVLIKGEKREVSIFFSDIVSFTSISENTDPELLVEILNTYFSEMTKIIHKNNGTLDKYIGDAVMCFFNAPLFQENHSFFACKTALEQQSKLRELNTLWQQKWYPEIKIRIGIHTGEVIHGNIGSDDTRVNYTVIGDSVNLASRLEGVCKQYGVSVCVSEVVYELQKDAFYFRELDVISVKGRQKPVRIYQLIGEKNHKLSEKHEEYLTRYEKALHEYYASNFKVAEELFLQNVWDEASHNMGIRCQNVLNWKAKLNQGVFIMHTK